MSVGLLQPQATHYWIIASFAILLPYCCIQSLPAAIFIGKQLDIRDGDLRCFHIKVRPLPMPMLMPVPIQQTTGENEAERANESPAAEADATTVAAAEGELQLQVRPVARVAPAPL